MTGIKLISYRDYFSFNINKVLNMMAIVNWRFVTEMSDVNDMEAFISNNIRTMFDKHAPIATKRFTEKKARWRNEGIKILPVQKNK